MQSIYSENWDSHDVTIYLVYTIIMALYFFRIHQLSVVTELCTFTVILSGIKLSAQHNHYILAQMYVTLCVNKNILVSSQVSC